MVAMTAVVMSICSGLFVCLVVVVVHWYWYWYWLVVLTCSKRTEVAGSAYCEDVF